MIKTLAFILSASLAACAGQAEVRYSGTTTDPELVAMDTDPEVMVVSNADEPVFYSDNSYWLYRDSRWYRSSSYRGGWAREDRVPEHVRRIERPEVYVHFRHNANPPRTTSNEGDRDRSMAAPRPELREPRREQTSPGPAREPNPEGPTRQYPNPLPPQQVPPVSPRPDTDRSPGTPEPPQEHARDQRPANDKADRRDDHRDDKRGDDKRGNDKRDDNRDFGRSEDKH
jgi:hypothetical protein